MSRNLRWLAYVFGLPATIINVIGVWLFYDVQAWHWSDGCIEAVAGKRPDGRTKIWFGARGQCWGGFLIVYSSERARLSAQLRVHERCHAVQGALVNMAAVPLAVLLGLHVWWPLYGVGVLAFAALYVGHLVWLYPRGNRRVVPPWINTELWIKLSRLMRAYCYVWAERQAWGVERAFLAGMLPWAWGNTR